MRRLLSAALAVSVSFAAFAPAQACISACGGGGGGSSTSTSTSTSTGNSYSPTESGDSGNHGIPGGGDSAMEAFLDSQRPAPVPNTPVSSTIAEYSPSQLSNSDTQTFALSIQVEYEFHNVVISKELLDRAQAEYDRIMEVASAESIRAWSDRRSLAEDVTLGDLFGLALVSGFYAKFQAHERAGEARDLFIARELGLV